MRKDTLNIAKELKITLKKVQTFPGHDGMQGIDADIYVDGKKVLHVYDSAHGGCFEYTSVDTNFKGAREVEADLEKKIATYPAYPCEIALDKKMKDNLDIVIDALVADHLMLKDQKKGLLLETKYGYELLKWKVGTIPNMIKKFGAPAVAKMIQKECDKSEQEILNQDYLKSIGVKF